MDQAPADVLTGLLSAVGLDLFAPEVASGGT
jgi:hypothetical protein